MSAIIDHMTDVYENAQLLRLVIYYRTEKVSRELLEYAYGLEYISEQLKRFEYCNLHRLQCMQEASERQLDHLFERYEYIFYRYDTF